MNDTIHPGSFMSGQGGPGIIRAMNNNQPPTTQMGTGSPMGQPGLLPSGAPPMSQGGLPPVPPMPPGGAPPPPPQMTPPGVPPPMPQQPPKPVQNPNMPSTHGNNPEVQMILGAMADYLKSAAKVHEAHAGVE